jgi:hypothetical protein
MHSGNSSNHFARATFTVGTNRTGVLTYRYAKSTKGGTAEVFVDGVARGTIDYLGTAGTNKSPEFKRNGVFYEARFEGLAAGQHTFELRNMRDTVFIDGLCLESVSQPQTVTSGSGGGSSTASSWSTQQETTAPGPTTSADNLIGLAQDSRRTLNLGSDVREISVVAEATGGLPIKLVLVDPLGLTVKTVDSVNGIAVLDTTVTRSGLYTIKVVNVSLGSVQVWNVATPLVAR